MTYTYHVLAVKPCGDCRILAVYEADHPLPDWQLHCGWMLSMANDESFYCHCETVDKPITLIDHTLDRRVLA